MARQAKGGVNLRTRRVRIIVMAIITIGLLSFLFGYWSANKIMQSGTAVKGSGEKEISYPGAAPKKLDADAIMREPRVAEPSGQPIKKSGEEGEEFNFTETLGKDSAPAVDPFKNSEHKAPQQVKPVEKASAKENHPKPIVKPKAKKQTAKPAPAKKRKKVALVKPPQTYKTGSFTVQVGSFSSLKDAVNLKKRLVKKGYNVFVRSITIKGKTWRRVQVGSFKTKSTALRMAGKLKTREKLPTLITSSKR